MASAIRMQKPEKEKAETDFGKASLSWKAKTNAEGNSVYWGSCGSAEKIDGRKPAMGRLSIGGMGENCLAAEMQLMPNQW